MGTEVRELDLHLPAHPTVDFALPITDGGAGDGDVLALTLTTGGQFDGQRVLDAPRSDGEGLLLQTGERSHRHVEGDLPGVESSRQTPTCEPGDLRLLTGLTFSPTRTFSQTPSLSATGPALAHMGV